MPRIGGIRTREACRFGGPVRECTVKHDGVRWHVAVVCEVPEPQRKETGAVVGVDVGQRRLATVYDGETVSVFENPESLRRALAKLQRVSTARLPALWSCTAGPSRATAASDVTAELRRQHLRVANLRLDASPQGNDCDSQAVAAGVCRVGTRAGLDTEPALVAVGC